MSPSLLLLCLSLAAPPAGARASPRDQRPMVDAMTAVVRLQPYLASPAAFRDPKNAAQLTADIDALSGLRHFFHDLEGRPSELATLYARQAALAKREFFDGDPETARIRLRNVSGLCIDCHMTGPRMPELSEAARLVDGLELSPLERPLFLVLTQQPDRALAEWREALVAPPRNDVEAFEQAEGLRAALSVAVRVKDDPALAVALLEDQRGRPSLSPTLRRQHALWLAQAKRWQAEQPGAATLAPRQLVARARALIDATGAAATPVPAVDRLVELLRATKYLGDALAREPRAPWRGEALYLLGVAAASTNDPLLWQLESLYLEACVRESPHTALARRCAARLADRTWYAYSARGVASMPPEVAGTVHELLALSR